MEMFRKLKHAGLRKWSGQVFASPLVVHWGLHKAMTGYFTLVMLELRKRTGLSFSAHYANAGKIDEALRLSRNRSSSVLLLTDMFHCRMGPEIDFRGSLTLRDPRDVVISSYHYHKISREAWLHDPRFDWTKIFYDNVYIKTFGKPQISWLGKSYSDVLSVLDIEDGLLLELARVAQSFREIELFDFDDPRICVLNYEEILANELPAFRKLFDHYGLRDEYIDHAIKIVDRLSASNQKRIGNSHIREATTGEWKNTLKPLHLRLFEQELGNAILHAGYHF